MKVIITGSTGMVGKGALLACIRDPRVTHVLLVNRKPIDFDADHAKVKEVLLKDFSAFAQIKAQLVGYDMCFHCMGVSSAGMSEAKYEEITYDLSKIMAETLYQANSQMIFNYVSGTGTDSSENGSVMWARVKGKTENMILNMGFKDAYAFRPGVILPEDGIKSSTGWYNLIYLLMKPFYPLFRKMKSVTTTSKLGKAMINTYYFPQSLKHLEGADINLLADQS